MLGRVTNLGVFWGVKQYRREGIGKNMTSLRILSKVSQAVKNKTCA